MTQSPAIVRRQVAFLRRRDGDYCHLCKELIDFTIADTDDPMHYSRDHLVPRALGGANTVENKRLAHRGCNSARDLTPLAEG